MDTCTWSAADDVQTTDVQHLSNNTHSDTDTFKCYSGGNGEQSHEWNNSMNFVSLDSFGSTVCSEDPAYDFEVTYESPLLKDGEMFAAYGPNEELVSKVNGVPDKGISDDFDFVKGRNANDGPVFGASSPGSKENFCDNYLPHEWPAQTDGVYDDNDYRVRSFQSSIRMSESASGIFERKNTTDKGFRKADDDICGTSRFDQCAIQIPRSSRNLSIVKNNSKCPEKMPTLDCQKTPVLNNSRSNHDTVKHQSETGFSHVLALRDHEYTLKVRPSVCVSSSDESGVFKSSFNVPSLLELLLRCQKKLNPNLGSDCLLSSASVLKPLRLNCRNVKRESTKRRNEKNRSFLRTQFDRSQHCASNRINISSEIIAIPGDDTGKCRAPQKDELHENMLKAEQMGVDHILTDGFGLDSCPWVDGDLLDNKFGVSESDFVGVDVSEEHSDWLQEEQRQEEEYLKSYLKKM